MYFLLLPLLVLIASGCISASNNEQAVGNRPFASVTETIPPEGGTIILKGLASIVFPNAAFYSTQTVTVTATHSPDVNQDFSATAEGPRLPYEIVVQLGHIPPATSVDAILNVPQSFLAFLPQNHRLDIFSKPIELSEIELLGHFHGYDSSFDPATNTIRTTLPPTAFSDDGPNYTFRAILILGAIPKYESRKTDENKEPLGSSKVGGVKNYPRRNADNDIDAINYGDYVYFGWTGLPAETSKLVISRSPNEKGPWTTVLIDEFAPILTPIGHIMYVSGFKRNLVPLDTGNDYFYKLEAYSVASQLLKSYAPVFLPKFA